MSMPIWDINALAESLRVQSIQRHHQLALQYQLLDLQDHHTAYTLSTLTPEMVPRFESEALLYRSWPSIKFLDGRLPANAYTPPQYFGPHHGPSVGSQQGFQGFQPPQYGPSTQLAPHHSSRAPNGAGRGKPRGQNRYGRRMDGNSAALSASETDGSSLMTPRGTPSKATSAPSSQDIDGEAPEAADTPIKSKDVNESKLAAIVGEEDEEGKKVAETTGNVIDGSTAAVGQDTAADAAAPSQAPQDVLTSNVEVPRTLSQSRENNEAISNRIVSEPAAKSIVTLPVILNPKPARDAYAGVVRGPRKGTVLGDFMDLSFLNSNVPSTSLSSRSTNRNSRQRERRKSRQGQVSKEKKEEEPVVRIPPNPAKPKEYDEDGFEIVRHGAPPVVLNEPQLIEELIEEPEEPVKELLDEQDHQELLPEQESPLSSTKKAAPKNRPSSCDSSEDMKFLETVIEENRKELADAAAQQEPAASNVLVPVRPAPPVPSKNSKVDIDLITATISRMEHQLESRQAPPAEIPQSEIDRLKETVARFAELSKKGEGWKHCPSFVALKKESAIYTRKRDKRVKAFFTRRIADTEKTKQRSIKLLCEFYRTVLNCYVSAMGPTWEAITMLPYPTVRNVPEQKYFQEVAKLQTAEFQLLVEFFPSYTGIL